MGDGGHLSVLQAIALAGGTTSTAHLSGARIIRKGPHRPDRIARASEEPAESQG